MPPRKTDLMKGTGAIFLGVNNRYRLRLTRRWATGPLACFVMLNPSTADAKNDDPTVRRCISFAKSWGYGGLVVVNIYALRATNPDDLWFANKPNHELNESHILDAARVSKLVVCAWGNEVLNDPRKTHERVERILLDDGHDLYALKITSAGQPSHPLYLPGSLSPIIWKNA
jgi:hypothetical protein